MHVLNDRLETALQFVPLLQTLNRSTIEVTVALEAGGEDPSHAAKIPGVDNVLYLPGNNPGERFVSLVNHVGQLSSCSIDWFLFIDDDTLLFPLQLPMVLAKYNPEEEVYMGNGSEEVVQQRLHGWFAQGLHTPFSFFHRMT